MFHEIVLDIVFQKLLLDFDEEESELEFRKAVLVDVLESIAEIVQDEMLPGDDAHQVDQVDAHGRDLRRSIAFDAVIRDEIDKHHVEDDVSHCCHDKPEIFYRRICLASDQLVCK